MQGTINLTAPEVFVSYGGLYTTCNVGILLSGQHFTGFCLDHLCCVWGLCCAVVLWRNNLTSLCAHTHKSTHTGCRCTVSVIECVLVTNCCFSLYSLLLVFHQPLFSSQGRGGCLCTALLGSPDIASCLKKGHKWPHRITWTTVGKTRSVGLLY